MEKKTKIAVPADAPDLDARVAGRLGLAPYLLVIDTKDMSFEAVKGADRTTGPGAGIQIVTQALGMNARTLLVNYISPGIARTLEKNGIEVISPVTGTVREALESYMSGSFIRKNAKGSEKGIGTALSIAHAPWKDAFRKSANQFLSIFPILTGVILLVGLFQVFLPRDWLLTVFSGNSFFDTLWGACTGSILAGNPLNSYVIGETLLELGVDLFGVTALMISWVTVGIIQLPAEIAALGMRFAVLRNAAAFLITLFATPFIVWISGGIL
ncbi:MAG TPA: NifB/NifX family molybdenum-iron cluster-binding protein [Desulfobacteraceae bacterium]|nr:NifB/NifX family molybdenum-iron cluster-binding protein [Desulfobacteraceae bacterium]HPQ29815.1 NifB/NifX family molybdenum-iron cluster-binding protein [Desulfobacteraceae bacterium]